MDHTKTLALMLLSGAAISPTALAGDIDIVARGYVSAIGNQLSAPFDQVQIGEPVLINISLVDAPTMTASGESRYPVDVTESFVSISGRVAPFAPVSVPPPAVTVLNDADLIGDRFAMLGGSVAGSSLMILVLDQFDGQVLQSTDLSAHLDLPNGSFLDGLGLRMFSPMGLGIDITANDVRLADSRHQDAVCLGDGTGALCPCGTAGNPGQGCAHSGGVGARLSAYGSASLGADAMGFAATSLPAGATTVLFSGTTLGPDLAGSPFGAGLRCTGRGLSRLDLGVASTEGEFVYAAGGLAASGAMAGQTLYVQAWYRDTQPGCSTAAFNGTQTVAVTVQP